MNPMDVIGAVLLMAGAAVFVLGALALFRLPDTYARLMAVALVGTMGLLLVLTAAFFFHPSWTAAIKVVLVIVILPVTSSVGTSALVRSAYMSGAAMDPVYDHLERYQRAEREAGAAHDDGADDGGADTGGTERDGADTGSTEGRGADTGRTKRGSQEPQDNDEAGNPGRRRSQDL